MLRRDTYSNPGSTGFNLWRAKYCRFRLWLMRGNLLVKIVLCLLCLLAGIILAYTLDAPPGEPTAPSAEESAPPPAPTP